MLYDVVLVSAIKQSELAICIHISRLPMALVVKNPPAMKEPQETWVQSLGQEDPWRRKWQPTPVFLPGQSHGQRSLTGYSSWGCKELDMTERLSKQENIWYYVWYYRAFFFFTINKIMITYIFFHRFPNSSAGGDSGPALTSFLQGAGKKVTCFIHLEHLGHLCMSVLKDPIHPG